MNRELIRRFLRAPGSLPAPPEADFAAWRVGLASVQERIAALSAPALRPSQLAALEGFGAHTCSLLLGPPGTGKTTVLSWAVLAQVVGSVPAGLPCRILVTAVTRDAVLTLLEAVAKRVRLTDSRVRVAFASGASEERFHPDVESVELEDFAELVRSEHVVVGMTTWSLFKVLDRGWHGGPSTLSAELFDTLCVDEASQMRVAQGLMSLAALRDTGRIIVSGDDRQLPPIGSQEDWQVDGLQIGGSLYGLLASAGIPEFPLSETFRLNAPLTEAPAALFYDDYVSAVPNRKLRLRPGWRDGLPGWLATALDPEHPVCILLHDGPAAATRSPFEAAVVEQVVDALVERIMSPDGTAYGPDTWREGLAVVTPHRAQNAMLRSRLESRPWGADAVVETVERIQGRERDAIVLSYTVSDPEFARQEAAFLYSSERFNVAITRPRSKLILVVSRRLLEVLPPDEGIFDDVRILREYVYGSTFVDTVELEAGGLPVEVDVRIRRFDDTKPLPVIDKLEPRLAAPPEFTTALQEVDAAVRTIAQGSDFGNAPSFAINKHLARTVSFAEYRDLFRLGRVSLTARDGQHGRFWSLLPLDDPRMPLPCEESGVRDNIVAVVEECRRGHRRPSYTTRRRQLGVRDRFVWCDEAGRDRLLPILEKLHSEGLVQLIITDGTVTVDVPPAPIPAAPVPPQPAEVTDDDFRLLNILEDVEIRRIELGVFESWMTITDLARALAGRTDLGGASWSSVELAASLGRLEEHGFLLRVGDRYRSRMSELARELRYVKQRFTPGDQDKRPFLVRSLRVVAVSRTKPHADQSLEQVVDQLQAHCAGNPAASRVLRALGPAMTAGFRLPPGATAKISGFQRQSFESILPAWIGGAPVTGVVITAETGSGKTEAACIPMLTGAAIDRLSSVQGARAVLVYPRIRLAVNQAERLSRYAQCLNDELGERVVTVGLQSGDVPSSWAVQKRLFDRAEKKELELWTPSARGGWSFPFFKCPQCGSSLRCIPGGTDDTSDSLQCDADPCSWRFDGWVGTKEGIRRSPPALFITITESLHQWLYDPQYGTLFGDAAPQFAPPRAVLADEIHLYSHVHGAQVGWTLRRLLERCRINGSAQPLAIGMSATLGQPRAVWSALSGLSEDEILHVEPSARERKENPRGREYFYFVQPEVESRDKDVAGASTTIQALMLLAHGMRRRTGKSGGFRSIAFLDSIDKLKRLHSAFRDAEENNRLAALRTRSFGTDTQDPSRLRTSCCAEPSTCSRFQEGECWYFAAHDVHQVRAGGLKQLPGEPLAVCEFPVFSGTKGAVDRMVGRSDVLFATSSLEVGYDDPDMALVYQHYAPPNLASFVQRKGRGGRGSDDRPITGVTLSAYSPRDTWYFRDPHRMLQAADFRVPLNMANVFVRRGQVLSAVLDVVSRHSLREQWRTTPEFPAALVGEASAYVERLFGKDIWTLLECRSLADLWAGAVRSAAEPLQIAGSPRYWGARLRDVPARLFDSPNVANADVAVGGTSRREEVGLAFGECAPGRTTRRWGTREAHWIPPAGHRALWMPLSDDRIRFFSLTEDGAAGATQALVPSDVREAVGTVLPRVARTIRFEPEVAGEFHDGQNWRGHWVWDPAAGRALPADGAPTGLQPLHHETQGRLLGFVTAHRDAEPESVPSAALDLWAGGALYAFRARAGSKRTGLRVAQVFWGAEVDVVLDGVRRERSYHRQVFADPRTPSATQLFGYGMVPEGIQVRVSPEVLRAFVDATVARLDSDEPQARWHRGQFLRYLVTTRTVGAGLTTFEARQVADLCITAAAVPALRRELERALGGANLARLKDVLGKAHASHLTSHPQLTPRRIQRLFERVTDPKLAAALRSVTRDVADDDQFRAYLASVVLHGLAIRLRSLFVIHGLADERSVLFHARIPVQFGPEADTVLTVCERSSGGDGTTRAFLDRAEAALRNWRDEAFVSCGNAETDRALDRLYSLRDRHPEWLIKDPRDEAWIASLATELGIPAENRGALLAPVLRLIYGFEEVGGKRFSLFTFHNEIRAVRNGLRVLFRREATAWELVSSVVEKAVSADPTASHLTALHGAYVDLEDALDEGTLSPAGRLADVVYRLSSRLCVDGCQGCLHSGSDIMMDEVAETCLSRTLLESFGEFVARLRP